MNLILSNLIDNLKKQNKTRYADLILKLSEDQQLKLFKDKYTCGLCGQGFPEYEIRKVSPAILYDYHLDQKYGEPGEPLVCDDCYKENIYKCVFCDKELDPEDLDYRYYLDDRHYLIPGEIINNSDAGVHPLRIRDSEEYPVCDNCIYHLYESCADCHESFMVGEMNFYNADGEKICKKCSEHYFICSGCNDVVSTEDEYIIIDSEIYCSNCAPPNQNDVYEIEKNLNEVQKDKNLSYFVPIAPHTLQKIINFAKPLYQKFQDAEVIPHQVAIKFWNAIEKIEKLPYEELFLSKSLRHYRDNPEAKDINVGSLRNLIKSYEQSESIRDDVFKEYAKDSKAKNMKSYSPMSVIFEVHPPRDSQRWRSFVVVMYPSEEMLEAAELLFGEIGRKAWDIMASGHWDGSIAYARILNEDGDWIIENLQSDADLYAFKDRINNYKLSDVDRHNIEYASKWWSQQIKNWASNMILALINYAKQHHVKLYLTPFKHQAKKWYRIPERNKDYYDGIPSDLRRMRLKSLNIPEGSNESEKVLPRLEDEHYYDLEYKEYGTDLWRLARRISRLNKISKIK